MSATYRKLYWHHGERDAPSMCLYEIEDDWVTRVVEFWASGAMGCANRHMHIGQTRLPSIEWEDCDMGPEVFLRPLDPADFESAWDIAIKGRH